MERVLVGYYESDWHQGLPEKYESCAVQLHEECGIEAEAGLRRFGPMAFGAIAPFLMMQGKEESLEEATKRLVAELGLPTVVKLPGRVDHLPEEDSVLSYILTVYKRYLCPLTGKPYCTETTQKGFAMMQRRFEEHGQILKPHYSEVDCFAGDSDKMYRLRWTFEGGA